MFIERLFVLGSVLSVLCRVFFESFELGVVVFFCCVVRSLSLG